MQKLKDKLKFEWEKFYLDCMRTSKANIFTKAMEISKKQEIKNYLNRLKKYECNDTVLQKMLGTDNVIETCYRHIMDYGISNMRQDVQNWLHSL